MLFKSRAVNIFTIVVCVLLVLFYSLEERSLDIPKLGILNASTFEREGEFSFDDLSGKMYAIHIFASWCDACQKSHHNIKDLSKIMDVYGVDFHDVPNRLKIYLQDYGNPYKHILVDYDGKFSRILGIDGIPVTIVVGKKGNILARIDGQLTDSVAKNLMQL